MAGKFEVFKDKSNKWRFRLKAANGEIIADSEAYNTKQGCLKGVLSVQINSGKAVIEIKYGKGKDKVKKVKKKKVKKEIDNQEKKYKSPKFKDVKPKEEIKDEKKVIRSNPNSLNRVFGPKWL